TLAREVIRLPAQHVAEEPRRFVVEVVTGDEDLEAALVRRAIEVMALERAARRARRASRELGDVRDLEAGAFLREIGDDEPQAARARERLDLLARVIGVRPDALREIEAGGVVPELDEDVPQREAVLAAGDADEQPLADGEHLLVLDRALDLTLEVHQEARP